MITKPSILTIVRNDNTSTWSKLHRGLETHDLAHYAVESILQFDNAFYGIINKGYNISDFELPKDKRPKDVQPQHMHENALITEHIVNLLEVELMNSGFNSNFLEELTVILKNNNLNFPKLMNEASLEKIRTQYHQLVNEWLVLTEGQELILEFKP